MHATLEQPRMTEAEQDNAASKLLNALARKANATSSDPETAADRLEEFLSERNGDAAPLEALIRRAGVLAFIYRNRHAVKTALKREPAKPCKLDPDAVKFAGEMKSRSYAGRWDMPDGRTLAEWTGTELLEHERWGVKAIDRQINGQQKVRDFYAALARKAGDRPVGKSVSDKTCRALARKVWGREVEPELVAK